MDSSALVKRYASEIGSAWVVSVCATGNANIVAIASVTIAEVAAALGAKFRGGFLNQAAYDQAYSDFISHARTVYWVEDVQRVVVERAAQLTRTHELRGYDAVQLASAFLLNQALIIGQRPPLIVVSADHNLLAAARAEGLPTDNPNDHL